MTSSEKRGKILYAVGQAVFYSFAFTAGVRLACLLVGLDLPKGLGGLLFLTCSVVTGALSAYFCARSLRETAPPKPALRSAGS